MFYFAEVEHTTLVNLKGAFIGANDIDVEGEFKWDHSGRNVSGNIYTNWVNLYNEPNDYGGIEDCVVLSIDGAFNIGPAKWFDIPCEGPRKVICEMLEAI